MVPGGKVTKKTSSDNIVTQLINDVFQKGIRDIHIEPSNNAYLVRIRKGRFLETYTKLSKKSALDIFSDIKTRAKITDSHNSLDQQGHFSLDNLFIQASFIPVLGGEKAFIRVIDQRAATNDLSKLGLSGQDLKNIEMIKTFSSGLVLVSGEGSSTTMFSLLNQLPLDKLNVFTIENRHTYTIPTANQFIADRDYTNLSEKVFPVVTKQRPNVLLLSLINSPGLARLAVDAASNNILVISSVPVSDNFAAIDFLSGLGVPPYLTAYTLRLLISQKLNNQDGRLTASYSTLLIDDQLKKLITSGLSALDIKKVLEDD